MSTGRRWWVGGALAAAVAGCGLSAPNGVTGVVKLDGKPVPRANVRFVSQTQGGRDALGFTNERGEFRLTTFSSDDGALPGKYKVVIGQPADEVIEAPKTKTADEAMKAAAEGKVKVRKTTLVIPDHYTRPEHTPLVQDIPANGPIVLEVQGK
jgi:hypothetical protein